METRTNYFCVLKMALAIVFLFGLVVGNRTASHADTPLVLTLQANKKIYKRGETVRFTFTAHNTGRQSVKVKFPSSQEFDITATPVTSTPPWNSKMAIWNWAHGRMFTQSVGERTIAPGATQTWTATWKQTDNQGRLMGRGRYGVQARLMTPKGINNLSNVLFVTLADNISKPKPTVSIRGSVTTIHPISSRPARNILGSISVEGVKQDDTLYDSATVTITRRTRFSLRTEDGTRPMTFDDLREGDRIEAIFTGRVAESYPVQATASHIVILTNSEENTNDDIITDDVLEQEDHTSRKAPRSDAEHNRALIHHYYDQLSRGNSLMLSSLVMSGPITKLEL